MNSYLYAYMCISIQMCIHTLFIHTHIYASMNKCPSLYPDTNLYMHKCFHIHIHTPVCIHTYSYGSCSSHIHLYMCSHLRKIFLCTNIDKEFLEFHALNMI